MRQNGVNDLNSAAFCLNRLFHISKSPAHLFNGKNEVYLWDSWDDDYGNVAIHSFIHSFIQIFMESLLCILTTGNTKMTQALPSGSFRSRRGRHKIRTDVASLGRHQATALVMWAPSGTRYGPSVNVKRQKGKCPTEKVRKENVQSVSLPSNLGAIQTLSSSLV